MKKLIVLLSLTICLAPCQHLFSQYDNVKAMFIYNFTKYLFWEDSSQQKEFVIGVYGQSKTLIELQNLAKKIKIGNKPLKVVKLVDTKEMEECNIVFISKEKSGEINAVYKAVQTLPVVLIGESPGLIAQNTCINFIVKDNKLKYEISSVNLSKTGVQVSSSLYIMGIKVD